MNICPFCNTEIPPLATRCPNCTSQIPPIDGAFGVVATIITLAVVAAIIWFAITH